MTRDQISEYLEDFYLDDKDNILLADGLEDAFLGVGSYYTDVPRAIYDVDKVIAIFMKDMSYEEAVEMYSYNVECAYDGKYTPIFMRPITESDSPNLIQFNEGLSVR